MDFSNILNLYCLFLFIDLVSFSVFNFIDIETDDSVNLDDKVYFTKIDLLRVNLGLTVFERFIISGFFV